jgi:non-canonical purine NTP pyrophosphatase (RdgB/HAM1 family)
MIRIPVESSDIVSIGYDAPSKTLEIEFHGGRVYQYRNVDQDIHDQLLKADSHGQYFNTFIHGRYRFDRIGTSGGDEAPTTLAFVTGNARKFRNLQQVCEPFAIAVEQVAVSVDEVQSEDAEEIAIKKAKAAYKATGRPVVTNDSYWNILALHGFPGAYMSAVNRWLKAQDFLKLMEDKTERTVICTDTLVYYDGKRSKVFSQDFIGKITYVAKGDGAGEFDKIVIMEGQSVTIAELEDAQQRSSVDPATTIWHDFAKWYNMQRRLGRV